MILSCSKPDIEKDSKYGDPTHQQDQKRKRSGGLLQQTLILVWVQLLQNVENLVRFENLHCATHHSRPRRHKVGDVLGTVVAQKFDFFVRGHTMVEVCDISIRR